MNADEFELEIRKYTRVFNVCQVCGHVEALEVSDQLAERENAIEQADSYVRFLLNEHLNSEHKAIL